MKTFRNLIIALGLLLLLYVGAYWGFARKEMRDGYSLWDASYSSHLKWSDWRKLFVPIASLEYRKGVERKLWMRSAGYWEGVDSNNFVRLSPDGRCGFGIGGILHSGKAEFTGFRACGMVFEQDGHSYRFQFRAEDESGQLTAKLWREDGDMGDSRPIEIRLTERSMIICLFPED